MPKDRPASYTPAPEPPADPILRRRFDAIMSVLAQTTTVTAAAESLSMSRNHFQTILHKTLSAIIETITPKPAGRPARPAREIELEEENARLRKELTSLQERSAMIERMMGVVSSISSGRVRLPRSRARSKREKKKTDEPEPPASIRQRMTARDKHQAVTAMRDAGVPTTLRAMALGVSESTARRLLEPPQRATRPTATPDRAACANVRSIVRDTHGLVGAASLAVQCGLSRRVAGAVKKDELRVMEKERKARCGIVSVLAPGVIRGFDAMHVTCADGKGYWLVAADAAIPYRTSIATVPVYDAEHVIAALAADFTKQGPPLVLRLDRIACQRTQEVVQLLERFEVLPLHGPPRHPYYYGQLERQNREHRAWQATLGSVTIADLAEQTERMRTALNALWARPTLDWCTAEAIWNVRPTVTVDRGELRADVTRRAQHLVTSGVESLTAQRLATEAELIERGLLGINLGGSR